MTQNLLLLKDLLELYRTKFISIWQLDDKINDCNIAYHRTIKMKPLEVKDNTGVDYIEDVNDKDLKLKFCDHVIISIYKNIFAKGYTPNWSEEVIKQVKNNVPWT